MPYYCSVCKEPIDQNVYRYSMDHFGKALCRNHQRRNVQKEFVPSGYFCSVCKERISERVFRYSMDNHGKALCMTHQKTGTYSNKQNKITPQARRLSRALKDLYVKHELEYYDGYKHVDIAIPSARLFLELDGSQHGFSPKQMIADDERDKYSQKAGWTTKRIPNVWIDKNVNKLASSIAVLVRKREKERKQYSLTGIAKSLIKKLSETLEGFE
jgi:very-short-patch-repair endonuclease